MILITVILAKMILKLINKILNNDTYELKKYIINIRDDTLS